MDAFQTVLLVIVIISLWAIILGFCMGIYLPAFMTYDMEEYEEEGEEK